MLKFEILRMGNDGHMHVAGIRRYPEDALEQARSKPQRFTGPWQVRRRDESGVELIAKEDDALPGYGALQSMDPGPGRPVLPAEYAARASAMPIQGPMMAAGAA